MKSGKVILILTVIFIALIVILSLNWRSETEINKISISGNYTISRDEILSARRLNDSSAITEEVNIDLIRNRISNHKEVKKVFVSLEQPSELKIEIIERRPVAIVNGENEIMLVDDELEIFPFKNSVKMYDLPVISGIRTEITPDPMKKYNKEDLRLALFLILNTYKTSKATYNYISEVNMADSDKVIVYMSEDSSPFYFPRKINESISNSEYQDLIINRIEVFESYLKQSLDNHLKKDIKYVDLRYENKVILNSNN
ncbi:MAG: FtsQ-type POTRA domain-containing protein [Ignavibacteria bacterium]